MFKNIFNKWHPLLLVYYILVSVQEHATLLRLYLAVAKKQMAHFGTLLLPSTRYCLQLQ